MLASLAAFLIAVLVGSTGAAAGPVDDAAEVQAAIEAWQQEMFEKVADKVVFISTPRGSGSGFFVSRDGLILTNRHVVSGRKVVNVVRRDGSKASGRVVALASHDFDLALVKIPAPKGVPYFKLRPPSVRIGSWVGSVGHGLGGIWTFTTGMVSNIYAPSDEGRPIIQTQIPLNPGNSGGPLFDRDGNVVGVVTAGVEKAQNVNFAIRIDTALESLSKLTCDCLEIRAPEGVHVFVDGRLAGVGPRLMIDADEGEHEVIALIKGRKRRATFRYPNKRKITIR